MDILLETQGSNILLWVIIGVMLLGCIWMTVSSSKRQKLYYEETMKLREKFVVGAKIKTVSGVFGEIVAVRTALDGTKVFTIKSGEAENAMTFEIDINGIACIDDKDDVKEEPKDENIDDLMKKVQETSDNLNEQASSKVIDENEAKEEKPVQSDNKEEKDTGDPFEKGKKKKSKKE